MIMSSSIDPHRTSNERLAAPLHGVAFGNPIVVVHYCFGGSVGGLSAVAGTPIPRYRDAIQRQ
jgi:hypothetical protein